MSAEPDLPNNDNQKPQQEQEHSTPPLQKGPKRLWDRVESRAAIICGLIWFVEHVLEASHTVGKWLGAPVNSQQAAWVAEWLPPIVKLGLLVLFLSLLQFVFVAMKMRAIYKVRRKNSNSFLWGIIEVLEATYDENRYDDFFRFQHGIRMLLVFAVAGAALLGLYDIANKDALHQSTAVIGFGFFHIVLSAFILGWSWVRFGVGCSDIQDLIADHIPKTPSEAAEKSTERDEAFRRVGAIFWRLAQVDFVYITAVWCTALLPDRPFFVGYLLPLLATCIFFGQSHAVTMVKLVIAGVAARFAARLLCWLKFEGISPSGTGGIENILLSWQNWIQLFAEAGLILTFWGTASLLLALLRILRREAKEQQVEEHKQLQLERCQLAEEQQRLADEKRVRSLLEKLGVAQENAIFAKNIDGRFFYANDVLLQRLTPVLRHHNILGPDESAELKHVIAKTDEDLYIDKPEYKMSDDIVLHKIPGRKRDHYSDLEPSFDHGASPGTLIWTSKHTLYDSSNTVIGLVGVVAAGQPIELQLMAERLSQSMHYYATLKNEELHVRWANDLYLKGMSLRIRQLAGRDSDINEPAQSTDLKVLMRLINDGKGPKDSDLYGAEQGARHNAIDVKLINLINNGILVPQDSLRKAKNSVQSYRELQTLVDAEVTKFLSAELKLHHYPEEGWVELHTFPEKQRGAWVEVWKTPLWEIIEDGSTASPKYALRARGIMVYFQEIDAMHMRRSIVWRWTERHFHQARKAIKETMVALVPTAEELDSSLGLEGVTNQMASRLMELLRQEKGPASKSVIHPSEVLGFYNALVSFPLLRVQMRMLQRIPELLIEHSGAFRNLAGERSFLELRAIHIAMQQVYGKKIKLTFEMPEDHVTSSCGDDIFSIIVALTMNAAEASLRRIDGKPSDIDDDHKVDILPVHVRIGLVDNRWEIVVTDQGDGFSDADRHLILSGRCPNARDGRPGGGWFYILALVTHHKGHYDLRRVQRLIGEDENEIEVTEAIVHLPGSIARVNPKPRTVTKRAGQQSHL